MRVKPDDHISSGSFESPVQSGRDRSLRVLNKPDLQVWMRSLKFRDPLDGRIRRAALGDDYLNLIAREGLAQQGCQQFLDRCLLVITRDDHRNVRHLAKHLDRLTLARSFFPARS